MSLISFLNDLFKEDGFELVDSNSKKYVIGNISALFLIIYSDI